jgi:imidazole glycerol-phosphate synthase subunit HisH
MLVVVDYGVGNIGALLNMYEHLGIDCLASGDPAVLRSAEKLILPGVGAFDRAMSTLRSAALVAPLEDSVLGRRVPLLGVCLGMQLLGRRSEEGVEPGLGWIAADVVRIHPPQGSSLKVPHVGWANVAPTGHSPLFPPAPTAERFYFVHSYHMRCDEPRDVAATVAYGEPLCCAVSRGNIHGVQFHPEKSHRFGMRVLQDFALHA